MSTIYCGAELCDSCLIDARLKDNLKSNNNLDDNTFEVNKYGKTFIGTIRGYQHMIGENGNDKFYVYMNVNDDNYSIWHNNWVTERDLIQICDNYKINVKKLLK